MLMNKMAMVVVETQVIEEVEVDEDMEAAEEVVVVGEMAVVQDEVLGPEAVANSPRIVTLRTRESQLMLLQ